MADIQNLRSAAETRLSSLFESARQSFASEEKISREEAFKFFEATGLPSRRVEAFKYTDLRAAIEDAAHPAKKPSLDVAKAAVSAATAFAGIEAVRLTFVNGHLIGELSDLDRVPAGVTVTPLNEAMSQGDPLLKQLAPVAQTRENPIYQLNTAFLADGALISVDAGATVETPIHLRFVGTGETAFSTATRVLVTLGEGAEFSFLESHEGQDGVAYQPNDVVDTVIADRANLHHTRLNREGDKAVALSTITARLGAGSNIESVNLVFGGVLSRHQIYLHFAGENATATVNGAAMLGHGRLADSTLLADHAAVGGVSREMFKTVIDGDSTGVFQGKIIVRQAAQKTDGKMKSDCLLLTDDGQMMNKPELEIFADDVACGHGATCGAPDEDLLFYLMARGLPKPIAESLLVQAFVGEAIESVTHEGARDALIGEVEGWLKTRG
ncbi:SufB/SufD family protein [Methylobacterium haplocladii]|uniref:Fe-S cluster assembly protein SufD n=1 Tax=Methylobacterium haplocladii TaxID=1176176 RepID=A0A512ITL9_9HYPH|nr:SufD family Fe-S cluster assembly protein [Methylobacterium haplocladii]GEP01044.1 Fe-S cluster assembly protein SufD [Methylobacterium haplocladii]GJD83200.1 FeS cluster assembly protein SufD [Methylobacterium haplocladii]GLS60584.1 Fe-S cluster assembly protein SufD [Methylobacterium haplocladii]